jgi:hypothetical protein
MSSGLDKFSANDDGSDTLIASFLHKAHLIKEKRGLAQNRGRARLGMRGCRAC